MNCGEFEECLDEYLSGEMSGSRRLTFETHRDDCAQCRAMVESTVAADEQLRRAVGTDAPDTAVVLARVRQEIRQEASRRQWLRIAAGLALVAAGLAGYRQLTSERSAGFVAAAAKDHRAEVVEGSKRRWRTAASEVAPLLAQYGLAAGAVDGLIPSGFRFEHAKQCGIDGERALHLVFSDGTRAVSVFVREQNAVPVSVQAAIGSEQVAGFRRGVVVTTGAADLCAETARHLAAL